MEDGSDVDDDMRCEPSASPWSAPLAVVAAFLAIATGCSRRNVAVPARNARGVILISLDTLRADHLGSFGYGRATSPQLDRLAARGVLFERAVAQYPSTLTSHITMLTGLHPAQHDVYPPATALAPSIATLAERLLSHGVRTAGFTEGGYMAKEFGFSRGFEAWDDRAATADTDIERTLGLGREFLRSLADGDRFFLFLHSYSVHSPYEPPEPWRGRFWDVPPPTGAFPSTGENLKDVNRGRRPVDDETVRFFTDRYDESISYVDEQIGRFMADLESQGLLDTTVVLITSDHGEEFMEHGRLAHSQVYPECLHVPLILLAPGLVAGTRVAAPVELVDIVPSVLELVGAAPDEALPGHSLLSSVSGDARFGAAFGEVREGGGVRTVLERSEAGWFQLVERLPRLDFDGRWVAGELVFDTSATELDLEVRAFHRPRAVSIQAAGWSTRKVVASTDWRTISIPLPADRPLTRVRLLVDSCDIPREIGAGADPRCLGVQLHGVRFPYLELYDLAQDPAAAVDLRLRRPGLAAGLLDVLAAHRPALVAKATPVPLTPDDAAALEVLGYLTH